MKGVGNRIAFTANISENTTINRCEIGERTRVSEYCNLYDMAIGEDCVIGTFVEMQRDVTIGNRVHVSTHTFICSGVEIGDDTFVGHSVVFINDTFHDGIVHYDWKDWKNTTVGKNVKIGSNATIFPIRIGDNAVIGAGAIVTRDVYVNEVIIGTNQRLR